MISLLQLIRNMKKSKIHLEPINQIEEAIDLQYTENDYQENIAYKLNMRKDYITYAKYKVIRNMHNKIVDMQVVFANDRMFEFINLDPVGKYRSEILPSNEKMCKYAQNVLDIGVAKHFSYTDDKYGHIEGIMEPDLSDPENINMYTIDINQLKENNNEQAIRSQTSTILSMFNITILHWNAKEHYIYSDNILTTDFKESNPDLYTGTNVRSSYELYKIVDKYQRKKIEEEIEKLKNNEVSFLNFNLIVTNSIHEDVSVRVVVIPEDIENMYMIGIQY